MISLALAVLAVTGSAAADADTRVPDVWVGEWTLNVGRSDYGGTPAPYKRATYRIERAGDGFRVVYDMVHPRGGTTHLEWTGRLDGRDYALQGVDQAITYAYTPQADGGAEIVVKIDARVAARSRVTVSADGRTMTTRTSTLRPGAPPAVNTTVYEKR